MLTFAATVLLDGISYGMVLFIISVGLTITLGLTGISIALLRAFRRKRSK